MRKHALALGVVAAVSFPAAADGLYVFGDVGQSKFSGDISETDKAFALGLGYSLNPSLSVELAYHDLGGFGFSESVFAPALSMSDIYIYSSVNVTAYSLSALAKLPLSDKFDIYGRSGYAHISIDATGTGTGITVPLNTSDSENKATYGIGAAYTVNEKFALRADYIKFGDMDLSSFTVGATYTF